MFHKIQVNVKHFYKDCFLSIFESRTVFPYYFRLHSIVLIIILNTEVLFEFYKVKIFWELCKIQINF